MRQRPEGSLAAGAFPETTTQLKLPKLTFCRCRLVLPGVRARSGTRSRPDRQAAGRCDELMALYVSKAGLAQAQAGYQSPATQFRRMESQHER